MKKVFTLLFAFVLMALAYPVCAQQNYDATIRQYLEANRAKYGLTQEDLNYVVTDQYQSHNNHIVHVYLNQTVNGVQIFRAVSSLAINNGEVVSYANRFIPNASRLVNTTVPMITPEDAVMAAAAHLGISPNAALTRTADTRAGDNLYYFEPAGLAKQDIKVSLTFLMVSDEILLAWDVNIRQANKDDWWNIRIDAVNGAYLEKNNWTTYCDFGDKPHVHTNKCVKSDISEGLNAAADRMANQPEGLMAGNYRVYPIPVESPNHGSRALVSNPDNALASPYGWHDNNGAVGAEFTTTQGNNVHAQEDANADDAGGARPDGGPSLTFDYALDNTQQPATWQDAAITNLFYMNNIMHDVLYQYGFDEPAGNFQDNQYGNGGAGGDFVYADAQDGSGTNNANFQTPTDGGNGRMQMYIWNNPGGGGGTYSVVVNSPVVIAGNYTGLFGQSSPVNVTDITAPLILGEDGTAPINDACEAIVNGGALSGNIAMVDRGTCTFVTKVMNAQNAGAIAVVVCNNVAGAPIAMGGNDPAITIPYVMISQADCNTIKAQLTAGTPVNVTLPGVVVNNADADSDIDNGIIAHEYGHGLSIRLTGGPNNSNCLNNDEQMGEGWSDYMALMFTMEPGDAGADVRGIGTYAIFEPVNGTGIRTYPYSTNMAVDPHTYSDIPNESIPHGVGSVWCVMLWDMTWALIDEYGYDPDIYNGTGGNNIAMQLVIEGMKLQPCNPGFVDGRDAILQADQQLYGGANQCLIWNAFARRGCGYSADQGSSGTVGDETEAFDLPPLCLTPVIAPTANFAVNAQTNCTGEFMFTDLSTDIPQSWLWDFGDGTTSTFQNPSHTYTAAGTYNVVLTASNPIGSDTYTLTVTYAPLSSPSITGDLIICPGETTTLTSTVDPGNLVNWYDAAGANVLATGTTFTTPALFATTTYQVAQSEDTPVLNVGSTDSQVNGNNHNTGFDGRLFFTTSVPLTLISVELNATGAGNRTITLYDGNGAQINQVVVNVPNGVSRATLNFDLPTPGDYQIGNISENLWRNNANVTYPYQIPGVISITGANAADRYYYFYDWEVQEQGCSSVMVPVTVTVAGTPTAAFTYVDNFGTVTFTDASVGATSWSWDFGDGNTDTQQNPVHTYATAGQYTVTLTVDNGTCTNTITQVINVVITSVQQANVAEVRLFPNPADEQVTVEVSATVGTVSAVEVMAADGRVALAYPWSRNNGNTFTFDASTLPSGVYTVRLRTSKGLITKRLTIEH